LVVEENNLRTAISRYYDFEQKKAAQSIEDIEDAIRRIFQTENAIRANLESANSGTKKNATVSLKNTSDSDFIELLHNELTIFNDNNYTSLAHISDFKNDNNQLISMIKKEIDNK
jgi:HEAT repeat protein